MIRFQSLAQDEKKASAFHDLFPHPFSAQQIADSTMISLDASRRSVVDGFDSKFRDAFLQHMLKSIPVHHTILAAFTNGEIEDYRPVSRPRHMVLWQDKGYSTDELCRAADSVQMLLSNLGFTRYPANILRPTITWSAEQSQKTSITDRLKIAVSSKLGLSFDRSQSQTRETFESVRKESTQKDDPDKGKWDFALPYLKEIGQAMDLMTPGALMDISSKDAVIRQLRDGTLVDTYQHLLASEVVLSKAVAKALPDWLKDDAELVWLLNHDYLEESLDILQNRIEAIPGYLAPERMQSEDKQRMADAQWALHMTLYAALYRGARQHIEDNLVSFLGESLEKKWNSVTTNVNRKASKRPPENSVPFNSGELGPAVQEMVSYIEDTMGIAVRHETEGADAVTVTLWPDLSISGQNPDTGRSSYYGISKNYKEITTPLDTIAFRKAYAKMLDIPLYRMEKIEGSMEEEMVLLSEEADIFHDEKGSLDSHPQ